MIVIMIMLNNANNNPLNNESPYGLINITKKTVFMIRDSTVKYLNNYPSRKRSRNTKLIKIRSFSGATKLTAYVTMSNQPFENLIPIT